MRASSIGWLLVAGAVFAPGCGLFGGQRGASQPAPSASLRPEAVLFDIGRASALRELLEAPRDDVDLLEDLFADAPADERAGILRDIVRARLALLERAHAQREASRVAARDALEERDEALEDIRDRRARQRRRAREEAEAAERERRRIDAEFRRRVEQAERARQRREQDDDDDDEAWDDEGDAEEWDEDDDDWDEEDDEEDGDEEDWEDEDESYARGAHAGASAAKARAKQSRRARRRARERARQARA
ncbi:MAG: hypothetical protein KF729_15975, partial [Sandaracinaceae bacterium]|nr:hypothetical protein [Sandaracinaceae bacterium]